MQKTTDVVTDNGLLFWHEREHTYLLLAPLAEDFISAPASQLLKHRPTLRESSHSAETCAAVNETEPKSAWNVVSS